MSVFAEESAWRWSDLLGYAADHTLHLVIELKPRRVQGGAPGIAKRWLHEVGQQRPDLYALFITPEFMLLRLPSSRRRSTPHLVSFQPDTMQAQLLERLGGEIDYVVDSSACLDAAIDTQRVPLYKLGPNDLEQVVTSWLESSLSVSDNELLSRPTQAWLVESGLHRILQHGAVVPPTNPAAYASAG